MMGKVFLFCVGAYVTVGFWYLVFRAVFGF